MVKERFNLYNIKNNIKSVFKFICIILLINLFLYFLKYKYNDLYNIQLQIGIDSIKYSSIVGLNFLFIGLYLLINYIDAFKGNFKLAVSFSITRYEILKSMIYNNMLIVFIISIIQAILLKIDIKLLENLGIRPLYNYVFFNLKTDNIIYIIISIFVLINLYLSLLTLFMGLNYRYNSKFKWIAFIFFIIYINLNNKLKVNGINIDFLFQGFKKLKIIKFIIIFMLNYYISYLLLRFIDVD